MIHKTEGLVLRWYPVTDSSRVVIWWTRGYGQLSTLVRGSQRPKSWMLGQFDLFYTCELVFFAKHGQDLPYAQEIYPLQRRSAFRTHWRAAAAASRVSDLLYRTTMPRAADRALYRKATETFDMLATPCAAPAVMIWFELQLLEELGLHPELKESVHNRAQIGSGDPRLRFGYARGGLLAPGEASHGPAAPISGGALAILRQLQKTLSAEDATRCKISASQWTEIDRHLDQFMHWHLDRDLPSRAVARDLILR